MRSLTTRLVRLEALSPAARACPDCGYIVGAVRKLVLSDGSFDGPDRCFACGRARIIRLEFDSPDEIELKD